MENSTRPEWTPTKLVAGVTSKSRTGIVSIAKRDISLIATFHDLKKKKKQNTTNTLEGFRSFQSLVI